jgi:integrating conjugative element protein (TIGR03757 family)
MYLPVASLALNLKAKLAITALLLTHATAWAETILITDTHHPVPTTQEVRTITLDLPATLETELSTNLPADPSKAQAIVQQRLTPALSARLTQAHQDVADAWSMGVTRIPAVVIDRKHVIYGETDIQRALERIEQHRSLEP